MPAAKIIPVEVPHYPGLRMNDFFTLIRVTPDIQPYFPEERDW